MSARNFFYATYWFSDPHIASPAVFRIWVVGLVALVVVGVILLVLRAQSAEKLYRSLLQRWSALSFTVGVVGLVLFFFRQQSAFILSWRIWFLALGLSVLPWFVRLAWYTLKRYPHVKAENAARELKKKYLPENN